MNALDKNTPQKRKIFVIGSNGRLAQSLLNYYKEDACICLNRSEYENWDQEHYRPKINAYFKSQITSENILFITSGILNAKEDSERIEKVNFKLPHNIIMAVNGLDLTVVTFGTILEKLKESTNPYVKSKIQLSKMLLNLPPSATRVIHFRLHTLYGYGEPNTFMFLGQLFSALKKKEKFNMTSGQQIREYHHLDDVAIAIDTILSKPQHGIVEITSGNGIRLRDFALRIFEEFKFQDLLNIGGLEIEHKDKFQNDYKKNEDLKEIDFRDPVKGVCEYLKPLLN